MADGSWLGEEIGGGVGRKIHRMTAKRCSSAHESSEINQAAARRLFTLLPDA